MIIFLLLFSCFKELSYKQKFDTPLMTAAALGNLEKVKMMLKNKKVLVNIDEINDNGLTALHLATKNGHSEIIRYLLEMGANPNLAGSENYTALMTACYCKDLKCVKALLGIQDEEVDKTKEDEAEEVKEDKVKASKIKEYKALDLLDVGRGELVSLERSGEKQKDDLNSSGKAVLESDSKKINVVIVQ